jgi:SulP family sulfate permease
MLKPKLLTTLEHYTREQFFRDLASGTIVGVVALPLAIAFAIASGVSPEKGLITAIIAGFLMAALGGSRVQIGGPTGAFVVIVYGVVSQFGLNGLLVATMMAGVLLVIMGLARVGSAIKFIPYPVIVGFTSGIALIILSSQVKDLFGLQMGAVPPEFFAKWESYAGAAATLNPYALAIGAGSLLVLVVWGRFVKTIPGSLVVLVASTAAVQLLGLPVETIGSRFGESSSSRRSPSPCWPASSRSSRPSSPTA